MDLAGKGQTTNDKHPAWLACLAPHEGDATIKQAKVILPLSLALDPDNTNGLCELTDPAGQVPGEVDRRSGQGGVGAA